MSQIDYDKNRNPLEKQVLYNSPSRFWPLSFQEYGFKQEGDFRRPIAVFWDFMGNPHYLDKKDTSLMTKTTQEELQKYITLSKTLLEWLSNKSTQRPPKCTLGESTPVYSDDEEGPNSRTWRH